ncbi:uncharacterized protein LOC122029758 isoform X2 [Zingiber officinale]|uniref:uncharacterized protein LOC122029758 isoform X2 n=1 Tax=Zingiber officinale TaxID=94328 RepID=UPI001C4A8E29|nr:uncharacterized protein LOC122029758 isoform X2 [Zingiber officinale]
MLLTGFSVDAFGTLTISLVILFHILAIPCIFLVVRLRSQIRQRDFLKLGFFNGPYTTRIFLVIIAICWSLSEIARLSFLKRSLGFSLTWQRTLCKLYILFNLGFSEPSVLLTILFLLRASLQKRESGALSWGWNKKTIGLFRITKGSGKKDKYFTKASVLVGENCICIYPLFSTILLGIFHAVLISYITCIGMRVYSSVINKQLLRRIFWLVSSVIFSLPARVLLLGFSVLPQSGNLTCELIVFLAFLNMLFCTVVGIIVLVYLPVADSMALRRNLEGRGIIDIPYDDYYNDSAALVANQSCSRDTRRSSDVSTKPGSISFRTMIMDDLPGSDEISLSVPLQIGSPSGSSTPLRHILPLREIPRY